MVGYGFYMFEGIGCLMPILRETENPQNFAYLTAGAQWTICILQILFSSLCYYTWADEIKEPIITELLPAENVWIQIMKLLYCINLIYSEKICIVPAFSCLEYYILGIKEKSREEDDITVINDEQSNQEELDEYNRTYWRVNILRTLVVTVTTMVVILVSQKLDKFYAISGAMLGMSNVLLLPSICHLKLATKTTC